MEEFQQNRNKKILPVLLLLTGVGIALIFIFLRSNSDSGHNSSAGPPGPVYQKGRIYPSETSQEKATSGMAVNTFVAFVNATSPMENDSLYTVEGMQKMSEAISELAREKFNSKRIVKKAEALESKVTATSDEEQISRSFDTAADLMQEMQIKAYPDLKSQIDEVKNSAESIEEEKDISTQSERIELFFEEAATAIEYMNKMPS